MGRALRDGWAGFVDARPGGAGAGGGRETPAWSSRPGGSAWMRAAGDCHGGGAGTRGMTRDGARSPVFLPQAPTSVLSPGTRSSAARASGALGFGCAFSASSFLSFLEVFGVGRGLTSTLHGGGCHQVEGTLAGETGRVGRAGRVCGQCGQGSVSSAHPLSDPPTGRGAGLPLAAQGPGATMATSFAVTLGRPGDQRCRAVGRILLLAPWDASSSLLLGPSLQAAWEGAHCSVACGSRERS